MKPATTVIYMMKSTVTYGNSNSTGSVNADPSNVKMHLDSFFMSEGRLNSTLTLTVCSGFTLCDEADGTRLILRCGLVAGIRKD